MISFPRSTILYLKLWRNPQIMNSCSEIATTSLTGDSREGASAQLQLNQSGQNIADFHIEHWNLFMNSQVNRKLFHQTCDLVKVYRRHQSKVKFLADCQVYGVAPLTCRARFNPPNTLSEGGKETVKQIMETATKMSFEMQLKKLRFWLPTAKLNWKIESKNCFPQQEYVKSCKRENKEVYG